MPPLGLKPRWLAQEHRLLEVEAVIDRYRAAGLEPKPVWLIEAQELRVILQRGGSLKQKLREALADANGNRDWSWEIEAEAVLLTVISWLEAEDAGFDLDGCGLKAAEQLRKEVEL
jgi:hypothetical protein